MLFDILSIHTGIAHSSLSILARLVIAWASLDLVMNLARVLYHLSGRTHLWKARLLLAIDIFQSFSIICFVLWSGWIKDSGTTESYLWYAATTLNLISISLFKSGWSWEGDL
jgi:hypothetical protein